MKEKEEAGTVEPWTRESIRASLLSVKQQIEAFPRQPDRWAQGYDDGARWALDELASKLGFGIFWSLKD